MTEQFANFARTTLNGAINSTVTTLVVTSASAFPTTGNFRINIDDELMLVTGVSSNTFTVSRGAESTVAAAHLDLATVVQILTAGSLAQFGVDLLGGLTVANSVSNSDGSLVISPTTGSVIASLNTAHSNAWSAPQTITDTTTNQTMFQLTGNDGSSSITIDQVNSNGLRTLTGDITLTGSGNTSQPKLMVHPSAGQVGLNISNAGSVELTDDLLYLSNHDEGQLFRILSDGSVCTNQATTAQPCVDLKNVMPIYGASSSTLVGYLPIYANNAPLLSQFTWSNQGTASAADTSAGLCMTIPAAAGDNLRCLVRVLNNGGSIDWSFTVCLLTNIQSSGFNNFGIFISNSASGQLETFGYLYNSFLFTTSPYWGIGTNFWSSTTSYNTADINLANSGPPQRIWLKCASDLTNTHLNWYTSVDGQNYTLFRQNTFGSTIGTPNRVGFYGDSSGATTQTTITVPSWQSTGGIV